METKMTAGRLGGQTAERRLNMVRRRGGPQSKNKRKTCCADGVQLNVGYSSRENVAASARAGVLRATAPQENARRLEWSNCRALQDLGC
jgi:hypothetical protein